MDRLPCAFCEIPRSERDSSLVFEDEVSAAFLARRPLFPGHSIVIPKQHFETLADLPSDLVGPLFASVQLLSRAVVAAMKAEGSFVAINNRISQSVPHLHVHVVPRRKGDGLKGFFWPRQSYRNEEERESVREAIRRAVLEEKESNR